MPQNSDNGEARIPSHNIDGLRRAIQLYSFRFGQSERAVTADDPYAVYPSLRIASVQASRPAASVYLQVLFRPVSDLEVRVAFMLGVRDRNSELGMPFMPRWQERLRISPRQRTGAEGLPKVPHR